MRIAIIGGGIGGLTAALALRQFGFAPAVFEQAPELLEVGAAILMWPNAMRVLHRLGLADAVREHGAVLEEALWLDQSGKQINRFPLPKTDEPAIALHRAALQQVLLDALPPDSIHLDHAFARFEERAQELIAHFADGSSVGCDVLIAADGLHSQARTQLLNDGQPSDRGYIAWRGVAPRIPAALPPASAIEIHGQGKRFGIGPLGLGKVGWWCSVNKTSEAIFPQAESFEDRAVAREQLAQLFKGWCAPIDELIHSTPLSSLVRNPVFDRNPVRKWGSGRLTLLGDAIHPMTPNLGQGGCLAIEDAVILARCLRRLAGNDQTEMIPTALRRFEASRYWRTSAAVRFSRIYGDVGQWKNASAVRTRRWLLSQVSPGIVRRLMRWMFDYDAFGVRI